MTYEERVQSFIDFIDQNTTNDVYVTDADLVAKESVWRQERAVREALTLPYLDYVISKEWVESYIIEQGFIKSPSNEQK